MLQLDLLVLIPLLGAVAAVLARHRARLVALVFSAANLGVLLSLVPHQVFSGQSINGFFPPEEAGRIWLLTIDGISAQFVLLTLVLTVVATIASWRVTENPGAFFALLLALQAAIIGVFLAEHVILFYVFWEAVLIPMYFLIGRWGHENRKRAAMKFFLYTFTGSVLMLVGILVAMGSLGASTFTALSAAASSAPAEFPSTLVYWLILCGLLVKIPVVPFHTWLPDAHVEAPTAGSILLAGVLLKMGAYGVIRLAMPLAPDAWDASRPVLLALGVIGIVYGALMAFAQSDLKRLIAYSSVSHMGFVLVALSSGTQGSLSAAMLVMVSHGLVSGLLFFLAGELYERSHTRELGDFGGLGEVAPLWSTAFTFAALASLGLPGLSGFPGELLTLLEGFAVWSWWVIPIGFGLIMAAAYNLKAVRACVHGPVAGVSARVADLDKRGALGALVLITPILLLGIWPRLVTDAAASPIRALIDMLERGLVP